MTASTGAAEKRRAQVRHAQRAYNSRKKFAHASMIARVQKLEHIVQGMYDAFLALNDTLITLEVCRSNQNLMRSLEATLHRALALASQAFEDYSGTDPDKQTECSGSASKTPSYDGNSASQNTGDATVRRSSAGTPTSPSLRPSLSDAGYIFLKHPLARLVFPPSKSWSSFTRRLHDSAALDGCQALMSGNGSILSQQAQRMFRYPLRHFTHEDVLKGLRLKQNFKNLCHSYPDGTVVVQRQEPHDRRLRMQSPDLDDTTKASATLNVVLSHIESLNSKIRDDFLAHRWESMVYLRSEHVESYLISKGLVIEGDALVHLPLRPRALNHKPTGARLLPANREPDPSHPTSLAASERTAQKLRTQLYGSSMSTVISIELDPRLWHQPDCFFPSFDSRPTWNTEPGSRSTPGVASSVKSPPSCETGWRNPVRVEDLIQRLIAYSVCDGAGPCFPLKRIDAALDSLLVGGGHLNGAATTRNGSG